uniref:Uncharacterized protein n=1 Tax=Coccidioides posadasii RMSCC 3488 TaxID=454284 RepID=A0A0J6HZ28_COCPO|nr:hypothetical protein CPAG_00584 [Coccidioides posadasii RMSCC 3488]
MLFWSDHLHIIVVRRSRHIIAGTVRSYKSGEWTLCIIFRSGTRQRKKKAFERPNSIVIGSVQSPSPCPPRSIAAGARGIVRNHSGLVLSRTTFCLTGTNLHNTIHSAEEVLFISECEAMEYSIPIWWLRIPTSRGAAQTFDSPPIDAGCSPMTQSASSAGSFPGGPFSSGELQVAPSSCAPSRIAR